MNAFPQIERCAIHQWGALTDEERAKASEAPGYASYPGSYPANLTTTAVGLWWTESEEGGLLLMLMQVKDDCVLIE